ncbi:MAG: hypothetical protein PHN82_02790 [bacterium]|nr:hypothetical protein [bacterium]
MDTILKKLCALLDSDDAELQCSAARVLGELGPKDRAVAVALARRLDTPNVTVRNYLLAALSKVSCREVVPHLFPALREGGAVGEKVAGIIAGAGPAAAVEVRKAFARADEPLRRALAGLLGRIGTEEACGFLVDRLADSGPDLSRTICLALREAIGRAGPQVRRAALRKVNALLASPGTAASEERTAHGVALLGDIGDPSSTGRLLGFASPGRPLPVRERALAALARIDIPPAAAQGAAEALIPMLGEDDRHGVVHGALGVLRKFDIPKRLLPKLQEGVRSANPAVRSFVLSQLGRVDSRENIDRLLAHLNTGGFQERRAAQEALAAIPGAAAHILRELDAARDYESGMRLVSILRAHRGRIGAPDKRRLFERLEKAREADDERHSIYAAALQVVDPDFLVERVLGRVKRLRAARRFAEIEGIAGVLARHALLTPELKYELAVSRLRGRLPDLSSPRRKEDPALRLFGELLGAEGFPLLRRLKTDRALGPSELYHLGFHFSEMLFAQREFGIELLRIVAGKWPRSKLARPARQKLALVGSSA